MRTLGFILSLGLVCSQTSAQDFAAKSYPFTPAPERVVRCQDAGYVGAFTFKSVGNGVWRVNFPSTGAKFSLFHADHNRYVMSIMGDMSLHAEVDFDKGTFFYEKFYQSIAISCWGTFRR